ncbi:MAG: hypothetical protein KDB01_05610 [Planctomycetaceae bacterium]|nr:hypothetical protein [Planctomycetaceae bacterium]
MLWYSTAQKIPAILVAVLMLLITASRAAGDDVSTRDRRHRQLLEKRQAILDAFQRDLNSVQVWCTEHQLSAAAADVSDLARRVRSPEEDSGPAKFATPPVPKNLPPEEQQWQLLLRHHREERGKEMYTLARSTLRAGFPSLAFSMIEDVIRIDPDHKYARATLGTQLFVDPLRKQDPAYAGEWISVFEKQMRSGSRPHVYHARYGWIPAANVVRYDEGMRPWNNEWVSVEKERELRRDFRNAWEIRSEHFLVRTNVSLEVGVQMSQRLEVFHDWLQQNFAAFFETPKTLQERFESTSLRSSKRKQQQMEVHYYATRAEYQKRVEGKVPPTLETNGLYWEDDRTSYFFDNPEKTGYATLYHEATHQILDLATRDARAVAAKARALKLRQRSATWWKVGEHSNFWILEGIACYFESFDIENGHVEIGNPKYIMFDNARKRLLDPTFLYYLPAQQFMTLGQAEFQHHPQIRPLYTQGAGFAHFLMHYEDGLYRDDLITLLSQIYRPDPDKVLEEPSLPEISGVSYDTFDRQYHAHMQNLAPFQSE